MDPLGMARALAVLAQAKGHDASAGAVWHPADTYGTWRTVLLPSGPMGWRKPLIEVDFWTGGVIMDAADALGAVLADLGVCEVIRG